MLGRRGLLKFVAGPPFVVLAAFFLVPLVLIAAFSFRDGSGALGPSDRGRRRPSTTRRCSATPAFMRLLGLSVADRRDHRRAGDGARLPGRLLPHLPRRHAGAALPDAAPHPVRGQLPPAGHGLEADARPRGWDQLAALGRRPDRRAAAAAPLQPAGGDHHPRLHLDPVRRPADLRRDAADRAPPARSGRGPRAPGHGRASGGSRSR